MKIKPKPNELAARRIKQGYTRSNLAKIAQVGKQTIIKLEEDNSYFPNASISKKICIALNAEFDELFIIVQMEKLNKSDPEAIKLVEEPLNEKKCE